MKKLLVSIVLVNLLAACASEKPKEPVAAAPATPEASAASVAAPAETPKESVVAAPAPVAADQLGDAANVLSKRSVYYPLDVDTVQDADKPVVQAHAKYLGEHPDRKMRLEGNADERGSNEYNLALAQRRADGVKKMLLLGGAKTGQIETVSYGEEKPKATGHDETSWSQNRRTDLNYAK